MLKRKIYYINSQSKDEFDKVATILFTKGFVWGDKRLKSMDELHEYYSPSAWSYIIVIGANNICSKVIHGRPEAVYNGCYITIEDFLKLNY